MRSEIYNDTFTQEFIESRYIELTAENWSIFVDRGLNPHFFNNFHGLLPGGYKRNFFLVQKNEGRLDPDAERVLAGVDAAIVETGASELLSGKELPGERARRVVRKPFAELNEYDKAFFAEYINLYKKLREKGFSHKELIE